MMFDNAVTSFEQHTIMIMAGGTGGHIYPAMAVADYLKSHNWRVVWLATEGGMENRLIIDKPYLIAKIQMQGVRGKGVLGWLKLPYRLAVAFKQTLSAMREHQPHVVLGMGGYAAFPGGIIARLLGKRLILHEQTSIAGLTNKVLSVFASRVLVAFPSVLPEQGILVGNPVRQTLSELDPPEQRYAQRKGKLKLLVVGGSLGATALNDVIPKALAQLPVNVRPEVIHQAGEKHIEAMSAHYEALGVEAVTRAFIQNMPDVYDLVICRAGALTIAEIACVGVASVLVPFPFAVDDHQTTNAQYLADSGAAMLVPQTEFDVAKVIEILQTFSREKCLQMAVNAKKLAKPEATQTVAKICMECAIAGV